MSEEAIESGSPDVSASTDTLGVDASESTPASEAPSELDAQWDSVLADDSARSESPDTPAPDAVATGERPAAPAGSAQAAPQQAQQSPWTQQDFQYAKALNISPQDLQRIGDPNVFRQMVNNVGQMLHQARIQQAQPRASQQQQPPQYPGFQPYKLPGDETMYDDGVRNAVAHFNQHLDGMQRHYQQQLAAMQPAIQQFQQYLPHIAQMQQEAQRNQQQSFYDQFDSVLDQFDESIVGRGKYSAIGDQTQKEARKAVAMQVEKEIAYHSRSGDAMPPLGDMVKRAFYGLYHDQVQQQQRAVVQGRVADRMRQTTASPARKPTQASSQSRLDAQWEQVLQNAK